MLVLTRKTSEAVTIWLPDGRRITVSLVCVSGSRARLGITAPRDINVVRSEVDTAEASAKRAEK